MARHPLDRLPSLRTLPKEVPAEVYNTLRVVLLRTPRGARLALAELRPELWALLDRRGWVIVDGVQHDLPLLGWTGFRPGVRAALNEPVPCRVEVYHRCAGMLMGAGLEALYRAGARHLGRTPAAVPDWVGFGPLR